jgi:hypothetical protein
MMNQTRRSLWRQSIGSDVQSPSLRHEDIAARAYAKYLRRPDWRGALDHWLEAERELRCELVARTKDDSRVS